MIKVILVLSTAMVANAFTIPSPSTTTTTRTIGGAPSTTSRFKKEARRTMPSKFILLESCNCCCLRMAESSNDDSGDIFSKLSEKKGRILILGGSGFLGSAVANRAIIEGYSVTSLSRRGKPPKEAKGGTGAGNMIDYREGDARDKAVMTSILEESEYIAIIHCIGILFDDGSGLRSMNRFVSGSGSISEKATSYDDITRKTAFNTIEAVEEYARKHNNNKPIPLVFTSAAEAGWPDVRGGTFVENNLTPKWLRRYVDAKRAVETRLLQQNPTLIRPIIFRPSLIYSLERIPSLPAVGAFFAGNIVGLPFVDRPMSVQALSLAIIRSIRKEDVRGVLRYKQVNELIR